MSTVPAFLDDTMYYDIADSTAFNFTTGGFAVCAWIHYSAQQTAGNQYISQLFSDEDPGGTNLWTYTFRLGGTGLIADADKLGLNAQAGGGTSTNWQSTGTVPIGRWCHVCAAHYAPGSNTYFYIDGKLDSSFSGAPFAATAKAHDWRIGRTIAGSTLSRNFIGRIASLAVFDRNLWHREVIDHMQGKWVDRPVLWLDFNNKKPLDLSSYRHDVVASGNQIQRRNAPPMLVPDIDLVFAAEVPPPGFGDITTESATVRVTLTPSSVQEFAALDAATVPIRMTPSARFQYTDAATVYLNLSNLGGECYSTYSAQLLGEGEADTRWYHSDDQERWTDEDELRWDEGDVTIGEGVHC